MTRQTNKNTFLSCNFVSVLLRHKLRPFRFLVLDLLLSATVVVERECFQKHLSVHGGGHIWQGCVWWSVRDSGGTCMAGGMRGRGCVAGGGACAAGETATAVDVTHSC